MAEKQLTLLQKLLKVKESVEFLKKSNQSGQGIKYDFVSSSQVLMSLRSKMNEFGILLIPNIKESKVMSYDKTAKSGNENKNFFTEIIMTMTWINVDDPSEQIICDWYGQGLDSDGEKGVGKALTYAEKYFLLKFFNIPTDKDDPDFHQESNVKKFEKKPQKEVNETEQINQSKQLYQQGKGSLDGFEEWLDKMKSQGHSMKAIIATLQDKLKKSEEQSDAQ